MDLAARKADLEQGIAQADHESQTWSQRAVGLRYQLALVEELLAEKSPPKKK